MGSDEIFLFIVLPFFGLCIILFIDYLIAMEFYRVAEMKGYTQKKYLWLPFLLGAVGYMLVIALPDRRTGQSNKANVDELPEL